MSTKPQFAFLIALLGCVSDPALYREGQIAESHEGMIVTAAPHATQVGAEVLASGGNAVDAAVAAAFALAVVEPTMSGLGGRTQMLVRATDGSFVGYDGGTEVPRVVPEEIEVDEAEGGYEAVGIPGTVAALVTAAREHGTISLEHLVQPAIRLAEDGFLLSASEASRMAAVANRIAAFSGSRRHFLDGDGRPPRAGQLFTQPTLARVLRAIAASGEDVFYRGWIADSIAADMARGGGFVTHTDLADYRVHRSIVVEGSYRDLDLIGTYLPASGATTIEALQILEHFDMRSIVGTSAWVHLVSHALLMSFADRVADFGTPMNHANRIVSKAHAASRAEEMRLAVSSGMPAASPDREPAFTTHLSVVDADGGMVALTQSVGPNMGSKVATPSLGFLYAATMGYLADEKPGDRPFSSQSPLFVMRDGQPFLILGASGARRIISALVASISRVVDGGLSLEEALAAPRLHPVGTSVYVEMNDRIAWEADLLNDVEDTDLQIVSQEDATYFAKVHAIGVDPATGRFVGVADVRGGGRACGPGCSRF